MTIAIVLHDGTSQEMKIYREVARHNFTAYISGFYANKPYYKWGQLWQLKGNERSLLHEFGKGEPAYAKEPVPSM